ncbi:MAG: VIT domain-containing protein [Phycisphaerales bacterium]
MTPSQATTNLTQDSDATAPPTGGRLVDVSGIELPLVGCFIKVAGVGGLAEVTLRQRFVNTHTSPLRVLYSVPLPADGVVAGYSFTIGERRIVGRIEDREVARERFERALLEGKSAALLDQERNSVFSQEVGNLPAGATIDCEITIDQPLAWLEEGAWSWRFPTAIAPRYLGEAGRTPDASLLDQHVAVRDLPARASFEVSIGDGIDPQSVGSSTHPVVAVRTECGVGVSLSDREGVRLDRDIEIHWRAASPRTGVSVDAARAPAGSALSDNAYALVTIVPPVPEPEQPSLARDLVLLLDTSGSMHGEPLAQAKRIASGLIEALSERDSLEIIEFSTEPRRWRPAESPASEAMKADALQWIESLSAGGGTEMGSGVREAVMATPGRERQRQVVLISDGLIGFERDVIGVIRRAAERGIRVHSVGIGPAANRSLTWGAARAGGGREFLVGIDEDTSSLIGRVNARLVAPLLTRIAVSGDALIESPSSALLDLMGAGPSLIPVRVEPAGGQLIITGETPSGTWTDGVTIPPIAPGTGRQATVRLFGRELIEDTEAIAQSARDARDRASIDERIRQISMAYGISSRMTSWIAIDDQPGVDPRDPMKRVRVPHELPAGLSAEGLGLRRSWGAGLCGAVADCVFMCIPSPLHDVDDSPRVFRQATRAFDTQSRTIAARLVSQAADQVVLEISNVEAIDWFPARVWIPSLGRVGIDRRTTTRDGRHGPDAVIRLVLTRAIGFPDDFRVRTARITMRSGSTRILVLEVTAA